MIVWPGKVSIYSAACPPGSQRRVFRCIPSLMGRPALPHWLAHWLRHWLAHWLRRWLAHWLQRKLQGGIRACRSRRTKNNCGHHDALPQVVMQHPLHPVQQHYRPPRHVLPFMAVTRPLDRVNVNKRIAQHLKKTNNQQQEKV